MAIFKRGDIYWYEFEFKGERIRESTRQRNKETARTMMAAHPTRLAKGEVGIVDRKAAPRLVDFAPQFSRAIERREACNRGILQGETTPIAGI